MTATVIVLLILLGIFKDDPAIHEISLPMPPGTTIAECEADHQVAIDANTDATKPVKFGYKCVQITLLDTSDA